MNFLELATERYSVRKYTDQAIKKEDLDYILEAGRVAPTAVNFQPQRLYVVQSPEGLARLNTVVPTIYGAPAAIVFTYDKNEQWVNGLEPSVSSGIEDVSIVATHVMLAAAERGLGTCWINNFTNTMVERFMGLPEQESVVLIMSLGYPAENSHPNSLHRNSKSIDQIVRYL